MRTDKFKRRPAQQHQEEDKIEDIVLRIQTRLQLIDNVQEVFKNIPDRTLQNELLKERLSVRNDIKLLVSMGISFFDIIGKYGAQMLKANILESSQKLDQYQKLNGEYQVQDFFNEDQILFDQVQQQAQQQQTQNKQALQQFKQYGKGFPISAIMSNEDRARLFQQRVAGDIREEQRREYLESMLNIGNVYEDQPRQIPQQQRQDLRSMLNIGNVYEDVRQQIPRQQRQQQHIAQFIDYLDNVQNQLPVQYFQEEEMPALIKQEEEKFEDFFERKVEQQPPEQINVAPVEIQQQVVDVPQQLLQEEEEFKDAVDYESQQIKKEEEDKLSESQMLADESTRIDQQIVPKGLKKPRPMLEQQFTVLTNPKIQEQQLKLQKQQQQTIKLIKLRSLQPLMGQLLPILQIEEIVSSDVDTGIIFMNEDPVFKPSQQLYDYLADQNPEILYKKSSKKNPSIIQFSETFKSKFQDPQFQEQVKIAIVQGLETLRIQSQTNKSPPY